MEVKRVSFIGAGGKGVGVVQNLAQTGHEAVLVDVRDLSTGSRPVAFEAESGVEHLMERLR